MNLTYGSVCSGIEAASVAWHPLGWRAAWLSEIEPFPSAVLRHHYPDVPNLGNMCVLPLSMALGEIDEAPDILVGGTPCQSFSLAGLRSGLLDSRGQLTLKYVELLNEIDAARERDGSSPCIAVWENVPGVLSSKDNAFGCFLAALSGESEPLPTNDKGRWPSAGLVVGPQRTIAWRTLDAQHFGLAQRRKRVFLVASARDDFHPGQVFFESNGLRGHSPPSRSTGKEVAQCLTSRTGSRYDPETETILGTDRRGFVTHALRGEGFDASEDGTGRGVPLVVAQHGVMTPEYRVRRLTPRECERLQGFPDDYTLIPIRGKSAADCPDGPRYKALGNSMAVPCMRWIGERIEKALQDSWMDKDNWL